MDIFEPFMLIKRFKCKHFGAVFTCFKSSFHRGVINTIDTIHSSKHLRQFGAKLRMVRSIKFLKMCNRRFGQIESRVDNA